jgi:hypothetical protein
VYDTTQDPQTFPDPTKWTPLQIHSIASSNFSTPQKYYTYSWHNVSTTCVQDDSAIEAISNTYFPTDRLQDISTMLTKTNDLQIREDWKMTAELWAGGPYTVSPPGMFVWLWKEYMKAHPKLSLDTFFYSGLDLSIQLFEAGRITWDIKKSHMEARPIQEVRNLFRSENMIAYDGTNSTGNEWLPYQVPTFVTPPFADFPSGHSSFSQIFANVMTDWFGPNIPKRLVTKTNQQIFCANLPSTVTEPYHWFTFSTGTSLIQPGITPTAPLTIGKDWQTWQDMADNCGLSRQYGGIHAESANGGGKAMANALHSTILSVWPMYK